MKNLIRRRRYNSLLETTPGEGVLREVISELITGRKSMDKYIEKIKDLNLRDPQTGEMIISAALCRLCVLEEACIRVSSFLYKLIERSEGEILLNKLDLEECDSQRIRKLQAAIRESPQNSEVLTILDKIRRGI